MKVCSRCKLEKNSKEFYSNPRTSSGLRTECKPCSKEKGTIQVIGRYGLSKEEYYSLLENQNGVCAICFKKDKIRLAVDHNHNTGKVRGLLCSNCNRGIGLLKDSTAMLLSAAQYLQRFDPES